MEIKKKKTRMYEPWGYRDENNYQGSEIIHENDLDSFFARVYYNKDDHMIHFTNKNDEENGIVDVSEFVKSDSIIEKTEYENGTLKIYFTNGDIITIDLSQLLDENEFKDGLTVDGHVVKILIDSTSEQYLSVSENGVKISGIDNAIQIETDRASSAETVLDEKIDKEIIDRIAYVDEEKARSMSAETSLLDAIESEITARKASAVASAEFDANANITLTLGDGSTIVATKAEEIILSAGEF